ncbi:MAG: SLBB domain-containing protein [Schleiferiaceae bacterium]
MKLLRILFTAALVFAAAFAGQAQNVFARKSLTSVSVDQLGEDEILLFKQNFENKNMTPNEALNQLKAKGMKEEELRKLKNRLNASEVEDPRDKLQMLSLKLLQMQDSLTRAKRNSAELSALERLYYLDSNVFGAELFRNERMDFAPNVSIATPPSYRIGPGDYLDVTVYGYQEFNRTLLVEPSGAINVPYVGVINLSGLTMKEARAKLYQVFSNNGYQTLRNNTSELAVNLKEVRGIDVTVVGAKIPGRYTVPGVASPYHVLHLAGGPAAKGSYRAIQLLRNGKVVATIDLYELLVSGSKHDDIRLEDGDVIFIPTYAARVNLGGEFKRVYAYEVLPGETLAKVLEWSGGFTEQAYKDKIYVERVGAHGFYAEVVSSANYETFALQGGDFLVADTLRDLVRNRVAIAGGIQFPGYYAVNKGLTAQALVDLAGGLREGGSLDRVIVSQRTIDGRRSYRSLDATALSSVELLEGDSLLVPSEQMLRKEFELSVRGEVHQPGSLPYGPGITLWDALMLSGGFTGDADTSSFEVTRLREGDRSFRRAEVIEVRSSEAQSFQLKPGDAVSVRFSRIRSKVPSVVLRGEFQSPGAYGLKSPYESLRAVLERSGGLTPYADLYGAYLIRQTLLSPGDTAREGANFEVVQGDAYLLDTIAIGRPSLIGRRNFTLQDGDELFVMSRQTTVRLEGAVFQPSTVAHNGSWSFARYLSLAGGSSEIGNSRKAYVIYPNGAAERSRNYVLWVKRPKVVSGSTVVVPEKPLKTGKTSPAEIAALGGVLASITTLIVTLTTLLQ